jgi:hypothetical protein
MLYLVCLIIYAHCTLSEINYLISFSYSEKLYRYATKKPDLFIELTTKFALISISSISATKNYPAEKYSAKEWGHY